MSIPAAAWSALAAVISAAVGTLAYVRSGQVARGGRDAAARAVDAAAYERAQKIYDDAISRMERQSSDQDRQIVRLHARVTQLEDVLRDAGMPVPEDAPA